MKQILTEWRKFIAENNKKTGTLNSDYPGYVELYNPYSENKERVKVGKWDDEEEKWVDELNGEPLRAEILGSWSDKGVKWLEVDINGTKGWIDSGELDLGAPSEEDNPEQNLYSFDFDNTLIRYHTLEDGDVEYIGPHEKNIQLVKDLANDGHKVIIVTSRFEPKKRDKKGFPIKRPWDDALSPEELIAKFDLPIEEIYYTSGNLKTKTLAALGVTHHWDDDKDEVEAALAAGLGVTKVDVPGEVTQQLRDKWINLLSKEEETTN